VRLHGNFATSGARRPRLAAAGSDYPAAISDMYLQLPSEIDPRIAALARSATEHAPTPYDKAIELEHFLKTKYHYTLDLTGNPGTDPLAHFLFTTRAGHCEYFASSMTVMLRTLGIPSREVNGFLPGEFNELGGDYIVRASDAHSWVEAYFPGSGWIVFDPTPDASDRDRQFFFPAFADCGLGRIGLERLGDQLRFRAPDGACAKFPGEIAQLARIWCCLAVQNTAAHER